jgi:transposase-like protein
MTKPVVRDPIHRRPRFQPEIIELCVRWYLTYRLSYRDLVEMAAERGITLSHSTIYTAGSSGTYPNSRSVGVVTPVVFIHPG